MARSRKPLGPHEQVRHDLRVLRAQRDPVKVKLLSDLACERLLEFVLQTFPEGGTLGLYRCFAQEADPEGVFSQLRSRGYKIAFPRVISKDPAKMDFAMPDPQDRHGWIQGVFGNPEPAVHVPTTPDFDLKMILVPGLGFTSSGKRMGMGKGFYDQMLPRVPRALRVGFCFDDQVLPDLPQNSWDQRVDMLITDAREIVTSARPWPVGAP